MGAHADLTAANSHVVGYVQAGDPGAIGAGKVWVDTSRGDQNWILRVRNAGDTGWNPSERDYMYIVYNDTTDNTPTELFLDGAAARLAIPNDTTWFFEIYVAARRTDADDESAGYVFRGVIDNNAGTTALVGAVVAVYTQEDTAAWVVAVTASDANDALIITVTGENAKDILWRAKVNLVEASG